MSATDKLAAGRRLVCGISNGSPFWNGAATRERPKLHSYRDPQCSANDSFGYTQAPCNWIASGRIEPNSASRGPEATGLMISGTVRRVQQIEWPWNAGDDDYHHSFGEEANHDRDRG